MRAPPIGSAAWDAELVEAGISRAAVEALVERVLGGRSPDELSQEELAAAYVDPGDALEQEQREGGAQRLTAALREAGGEGELGSARELVLTVAAELLLEQRCPRQERWHLVGYGLRWLPLEEPQAWRWYARQLAALAIAGDSQQRAQLKLELKLGSALEQERVADALFPEMEAALPPELHLWLMTALPAVSWEVKRAQCERLMAEVLASRPAPEIDSAEWEEELSLLGVSEVEVKAYYADIFGGVGERGGVSHLDVFHSFDEVRWRDGGQLQSVLSRRAGASHWSEEAGSDALARQALQAAVIFYAFWRSPGNADLDYLRVCGWALHDQPKPHLPLVRRWMSRQIAACLMMAWQEASAAGGVPSWIEIVKDQFFGFTDLDPVLFPWLVADVPAEWHGALLEASSTVAWQAKREFYARCAEAAAPRALQVALGEALAKSCTSGVFHSIDAREGLALLHKLEAAGAIGAARGAELRALLTEPIAAIVMAAAEPAESRFRDEHPGECFLALSFPADWLMWLMDADLWLGDECFGPLATWYHGLWPEGPTTGRQGLQRDGAAKPVPVERRRDAEGELGAAASAKASAEKQLAWHAIALSYDRAASLVGLRVELRPRLR